MAENKEVLLEEKTTTTKQEAFDKKFDTKIQKLEQEKKQAEIKKEENVFQQEEIISPPKTETQIEQKVQTKNSYRPLWYDLNLSGNQKEENCENVEEITTSSTITTPNYDTIKTTDTGISFEQKTRKRKFRKKLSVITCSIIVALCAGLITYNAIEIAHTNYQVAQIMIKIDSLDNANKLNDEDTLLSNTLPLETKPLVEPTKTQKQTNWFDGICNFFSHLFGG